ncbi:MAG: hypothetical protein IPM23_27055 [Candidatus Melainabacteria bacterium]|nr:hypothetical protein [Candidatus Melainabacteria bacterium]
MLKRSLCLNAILASALVASMLAGCGTGSGGSESPVVTPQGTMELERLKVGIPEQTLEKAVITFELDENPLSRVGGKTQYLSRTRDKKNGKYLLHCNKGNCFQIQALYTDKPITKEEAMEVIKTLLPEGAPEQSRMEETKEPDSDNKIERYYFGEDYMADMVFPGADGTEVQIVTVYDLPKFRAYISPDKSAVSEESGEAAKEEPKKEAAGE